MKPNPQNKSDCITLVELAKLAGCSAMTVSRVATGKWRGEVSSDTANRIRRMLHGHGYRPNIEWRHRRTLRRNYPQFYGQ